MSAKTIIVDGVAYQEGGFRIYDKWLKKFVDKSLDELPNLDTNQYLADKLLGQDSKGKDVYERDVVTIPESVEELGLFGGKYGITEYDAMGGRSVIYTDGDVKVPFEVSETNLKGAVIDNFDLFKEEAGDE